MNVASVVRGDARHIPLPDESVDLIVTSPPYFALRSYTDGGEHYAGQIGAEPTPAEYIAALIECTREWVRVLKPSGSIFVNLGDKYAGQGSATRSAEGSPGLSSVQNSCDSSLSAQFPQYPSHPSPNSENDSPHSRQATSLLGIDSSTFRQGARDGNRRSRPSAVEGIPGKSLMLLPERYRIAAVDELGLIARAVIVWSKPNGLPESVTDRVRRSHEDWVHLTKLPRYFSAVDEIREPHARVDGPRPLGTRNATQRHVAATDNTGWKDHDVAHNPLGKLPGSVWEIATEPLKVPAELGINHFAAFPTEWPRRIILGWSPSGICTACGEGRRPVAERVADGRPRVTTTGRDPQWQAIKRAEWQEGVQRTITGDACACPDTSAPTRPAVVLDPFGGTGTTALVASVLGRHGISVDMSADYCRLARWRTSDPGQRAKAARVAAPPKQVEGQADLFTGMGVAV